MQRKPIASIIRSVTTAGLIALATSNAHAWDFSVSTSGNEVTVVITGMQSSYQTCAGASIDDPNSGGASCSQPGASSHTITLTCNRVGPHTVFANVADDTTGDGYEIRGTPINISDPPPPYCPAFEFYSRTSRALTHKYGNEAWPVGQERDGQVEVVFKPIQVSAGTVIYAKVFDPKDGAFYRTIAAPGDNLDSAAGTLTFSPSDAGTRTLTFLAGDQPLSTI